MNQLKGVISRERADDSDSRFACPLPVWRDHITAPMREVPPYDILGSGPADHRLEIGGSSAGARTRLRTSRQRHRVIARVRIRARTELLHDSGKRHCEVLCVIADCTGFPHRQQLESGAQPNAGSRCIATPGDALRIISVAVTNHKHTRGSSLG